MYRKAKGEINVGYSERKSGSERAESRELHALGAARRGGDVLHLRHRDAADSLDPAADAG